MAEEAKNVLGTVFRKGQGLGNRLFCYVSTRALAENYGYTFATGGRQFLDADFLHLDLGEEVGDTAPYLSYEEKDERLYLPTAASDLTRGIDIRGTDEAMLDLLRSHGKEKILLSGNLQAEAYFGALRDEICSWLFVDENLVDASYGAEDLCILNVRGSEYADSPELFLEKRYWTDAMALMRRENPSMRFCIITEDVEAAEKLLPGIPVHHGTPAEDYAALHVARNLIVSNSSFAFFPVYTSRNVRKVIAPKYWARHNVSDGYWSTAQNIYSIFTYLDRKGRLFTADECRKELAAYRVPETRKREENDPEVLRVKKRNGRKNLMNKALHKAERMLHRS